MHSGTIVFGLAMRRSEKWRVYRIRTANSTYELEVQAEGAEGTRRCAVLTCVEPKRSGASFEDSAPRVGSESLYALSPVDWIGKRLAVGTACTSEIHSVDFVKTADSRAPHRQAPPPPPPPPAAVRHVTELEMVENAASLLKAACHHHDLAGSLQHDPLLLKRYRLALAACGVMLEALEKRAS